MWQATLAKLVFATLATSHAELMDVQNFTGSQILMKQDVELSGGNAALAISDNTTDINYCFMHTDALARLPAKLVLTIDTVQNDDPREAYINAHTKEGANVSLTCMIFGQARMKDVNQALNPSLQIVGANLSAAAAEDGE